MPHQRHRPTAIRRRDDLLIAVRGAERSGNYVTHIDGYASVLGGVQPTRTAQCSAAAMMRSHAGSLTA